MKKLFLPYELAVTAKEKGFDEPCFGQYLTKKSNNPGKLYAAEVTCLINEEYQKDGYPDFFQVNNSGFESVPQYCAAPLYQQIVDWFREKHGIIVYAFSVTVITHKAKIEGIKGEWMGKDGGDYYEALTEAIEEAFKLIS